MENKKEKKALVILIAVLACLLIGLVLFLLLYRGAGQPAEPGTPTTTVGTEQTATSATEATTVAATEATTEATTEPTEAETQPSGSSTPGGSGGYNPGGTGVGGTEDEEEEPKEEEKAPEVAAPGTAGNPYGEHVVKVPSDFKTVNIPAGESVSYVFYGARGKTLTVADESVEITYLDKVVKPDKNGVVTIDAERALGDEPVLLTLTNKASTQKRVTLHVEEGPGTQAKPYTLTEGEMKAVVMASDTNGVFYAYTADKTGVLSVQCTAATEDAVYNYAFYNQTTGEYRTLEADGAKGADGKMTLSIAVKAGETVLLQVDVLPGADGKEMGAELDTVTAFKAGGKAPEAGKRQNYTVTVKGSGGKTMANVALQLQVDGLTVDMTTDTKGSASMKLPEGSYSVTLTVPEGYTADAESYSFAAGSFQLDIVLKSKNQNPPAQKPDDTKPTDPTEPEGTEPGGETQPTEPTVPAEMTYTVTVTDYAGNAQTGIVVQFLKDGTQVGMQPLSAEGKASMTLTTGTYTVKLAFSGTALPYEQSTAVVTAEAPDLHIKIATGEKGEAEELYVGNAYYVEVGGTYVTLQADAVNYFLFVPTQSGNYQFSTSNKEARIGFWGGSTAFINDLTGSTDYTEESNAFTRNVKEGNLGGTYIIGITGADSCILEITRLGDAILDESDMVPEVYNAKTPPTSYSHSASGTLTYVDLTSAAKAVYNETDGKYHLNDANGPVLYVNLGKDAPYISMWNMLGFTGYGGTSLQKVFRDGNGVALRKEDYTACMISYVECADSKTGLYPLTEDLIYMIRNGGEYKGWWDSSNGNYVFTDITNLNTETAWMFACCYYS